MTAFDFLEYLWRRRRFILVAWAAAVGLAFGASLLLPTQYKAICRVVIEAPAGADPRVSTAISPIYLESLRTYEHFAYGDSLFQRALERFHLREQYQHRPIESLKRSVLEVEIPRNTRILEIRATLHDARAAHDLALYIAEEAVQLSRSVAQEGDDEIVKAAEKIYQEARARRDEADAAWSKANARGPVDGLAAETEEGRDLKNRLERQLYQEDVASAEYADRAQALGQSGTSAPEARSAALEARSAKVRAQNLRTRIEQLDQETRRRQTQLQQRTVEIEQLEARRKAAQASLDAAEARVREARASVGARGERLRLIDPGVVPERRSSPNVTLNVMAAWLLATVAVAAYLALEFSYGRSQAEASRHSLHAARHRE